VTAIVSTACNYASIPVSLALATYRSTPFQIVASVGLIILGRLAVDCALSPEYTEGGEIQLTPLQRVAARFVSAGAFTALTMLVGPMLGLRVTAYALFALPMICISAIDPQTEELLSRSITN